MQSSNSSRTTTLNPSLKGLYVGEYIACFYENIPSLSLLTFTKAIDPQRGIITLLYFHFDDLTPLEMEELDHQNYEYFFIFVTNTGIRFTSYPQLCMI